MLFTSLQFLFFVSIVLILFVVISNSSGKRFLLLAASYYFYGNLGKKYVIYLILVTLTSYLSAQIALRSNSPRKKRVVKTIGIGLVLSILSLCKIPNGIVHRFLNAFLDRNFADSFSSLFLLPIGLSFYSFQSISYILDVEKRLDRRHSFFDYALYLSFFPQILAGPIERPSELISQITGHLKFTRANFILGLEIILLGVFKKLAIADQLAHVKLSQLSKFAELSLLETWELMIAFALNIYFDFSGYTNIARGTALLFGIRLSNNYFAPYLATGISSYWQRRHMTLSQWFRDYLYFPLGGNRLGRGRQIFNIYIVMFFSGIWHGLSLNYLIWGLGHATGISINKMFASFLSTKSAQNIRSTLLAPLQKIPRFFRTFFSQLFTFLFVVSLFSFFVGKDIEMGKTIFLNLFQNNSWGDIYHAFNILFLLGILYAMDLPVIYYNNECFTQYLPFQIRISTNVFMILAILVTLSFGVSTAQFIYFDY